MANKLVFLILGFYFYLMVTTFEYPRGDGFTISADEHGCISIEQTTYTDDSSIISLTPIEAKALVDQISKILSGSDKADAE